MEVERGVEDRCGGRCRCVFLCLFYFWARLDADSRKNVNILFSKKGKPAWIKRVCRVFHRYRAVWRSPQRGLLQSVSSTKEMMMLFYVSRPWKKKSKECTDCGYLPLSPNADHAWAAETLLLTTLDELDQSLLGICQKMYYVHRHFHI